MTVVVTDLSDGCENDQVGTFERGERILADRVNVGDYLTFSRRTIVLIEPMADGYLRFVSRGGRDADGAWFVQLFTPKTPLFVIRKSVTV